MTLLSIQFASEVSFSSEINAPASIYISIYNIYHTSGLLIPRVSIYISIYIIYILSYVWPFDPPGGAKCKVASTCNRNRLIEHCAMPVYHVRPPSLNIIGVSLRPRNRMLVSCPQGNEE